MAYYRLYFLGGGSGPISDFNEFEVDGDEAAIAVAERLRRMGAMELWSMGRKVRRWEPVAAVHPHSFASRYRASGSSRLASP